MTTQADAQAALATLTSYVSGAEDRDDIVARYNRMISEDGLYYDPLEVHKDCRWGVLVTEIGFEELRRLRNCLSQDKTTCYTAWEIVELAADLLETG